MGLIALHYGRVDSLSLSSPETLPRTLNLIPTRGESLRRRALGVATFDVRAHGKLPPVRWQTCHERTRAKRQDAGCLRSQIVNDFTGQSTSR
jgi:hypothetical protein